MKIIVKGSMIDAEYTISDEASMGDVLDAFVNAALLETYTYTSIIEALREKADEMEEAVKNDLSYKQEEVIDFND